MKEKIKEVLQHYKIGTIRSIELIESTYPVYLITAESGAKYILKDKGNVEKMMIHNTISSTLDQYEVKAPKPVLTKLGMSYVQQEAAVFYLTHYIEGAPLSHTYIDEHPEVLATYGSFLAHLHQAIKNITLQNGVSETDLLHDTFKWALPEIKKANLMTDKLRALEVILNHDLERHIHSLPYQFIHRDYHPGNVLFDKGQVTGIIDFDLCIKGYPIFDLTYFLTSLLADRFRDKTRLDLWLTYKDRVITGYQKLHLLSEAEINVMWYLMIVIELIFVAYFLELDDDENIQFTIEILEWLYDNKEQIR